MVGDEGRLVAQGLADGRHAAVVEVVGEGESHQHRFGGTLRVEDRRRHRDVAVELADARSPTARSHGRDLL